MKQQTKELEEIKKDILPILQKADVQKAALFGSYVRGDYTKHKVDIVTYRSVCPHIKDSVFANQYPIL